MKWITTICIITSCLIFSRPAEAQPTKALSHDLDRLSALYPAYPETKKKPLQIRFDNEIRMLMTGSFAFYKKFVSPQDALSCAFHPSCSAYAMQTLEMNGILGLFDAIDRLTRCNGFSPEKYERYHESTLFYDPVRKIR